jgi:transposase
MLPITLPDLTWQKIYGFLKTCSGIYVGNEDEIRRFLEAILWITRSGAQWRLLPPTYGNWNSVYQRFARWDACGIWAQLHRHFSSEPDLEWLVLDSTIIRAHPCAAGALKKTVDKPPKPWGAVAAASAPKSI